MLIDVKYRPTCTTSDTNGWIRQKNPNHGRRNGHKTHYIGLLKCFCFYVDVFYACGLGVCGQILMAVLFPNVNKVKVIE